jgi:hypothetical protein
MQRLRSNQQRNRRVALLHRQKTFHNNEAPKESEPPKDTDKELD